MHPLLLPPWSLVKYLLSSRCLSEKKNNREVNLLSALFMCKVTENEFEGALKLAYEQNRNFSFTISSKNDQQR